MINYNLNLLNSVKNELDEHANHLENQARQIMKQCETAIDALDKEIKVAEQQMAMLDNELKAASAAIKMNNETKVRCRQQISSLNNTISDLKSQLSSIDSQISSCEDSSTKSQLKSQKNKLKERIGDCRGEINELERKIEAVGNNNSQLEAIKGKIREEHHKCYEHKEELSSQKGSMEIAYRTFKDDVFPRVMGEMRNDIIPNMEQTIYKANALSKGILNLVDSNRNIYSMDVTVDDPSVFISTAKKLRNNLSNLRSHIYNVNSSTSSFSHNLKDRVSYYASGIVNSTSNEISNKSDACFDNKIDRMEDVYSLCREYENVSLSII